MRTLSPFSCAMPAIAFTPFGRASCQASKRNSAKASCRAMHRSSPPPNSTIWSRILPAFEVSHETHRPFSHAYDGRFGPGALRPDSPGRRRARTLAHVFGKLRSASLLAAGAIDPCKRGPPQARLGVPGAEPRWSGDHAAGCGWRDVHHRTADGGQRARPANRPAPVDLGANPAKRSADHRVRTREPGRGSTG